jgi:DNA-binding transcriptional MerR regulator
MGAIPRQREETKDAGAWRVGELARRTGVSVRTLHYYEEIGLLSPSRRTEAGHRLYTAGDIVRLQKIKSLQRLGFTLREIRDCLDRLDFPLGRVVRLHLSQLRARIELQERLCTLLERVEERLRAGEEVSSGQFVTTVMEVIEMSERLHGYYTPEQLEYLAERRRGFGEEKIRRAEAEWAGLIERVRAEMEAGTDPSEERVQALARRSMELVDEFTGGDPGIERSVSCMWQQEENIHGIDTREMQVMMAYLSRARVASSEARGEQEARS